MKNKKLIKILFSVLLSMFFVISSISNSFMQVYAEDNNTTETINQAEEDEYQNISNDEEQYNESVTMTAQSWSQTTDFGICVEVSAQEGVFPDGTTMTVVEVNENTIIDIASSVVDCEIVDAYGVDISFYDTNGIEIEPNGIVDVRIINTKHELEGEIFSIVHIEDNNNVEIIEGDVTSTSAEFEANSFSTYVVIGATGTTGALSATLKATISNAKAMMIAYHSENDWEDNKFVELISGDTVKIENYLNSSEYGYLLVFLKAEDGFLITGLNADGKGDIYPVDGTDFGGIKDYPKLQEICKIALDLGYTTVFGYHRKYSTSGERNWEFTVSGQKVGIDVNASTTTEAVHPGDDITLSVEILSKEEINSESTNRVISREIIKDSVKINDTDYEIQNLRYDSEKKTWYGTIEYKVLPKDCLAGEINLDVSAEVKYSIEVSKDHISTQTVSSSDSVTVNIASMAIELVGNSVETTYDGKEHSISGIVTDTFVIKNQTYKVSGYKTSGALGKDAYVYENIISGEIKVETDGHDVTSLFDIIKTNGKLTISPAKLTLTSESAEKEYDGNPLTNENVIAEGFVEGEGATYSFTGSQTLVGSSENTFSYSLNDGVKESNYDIQPLKFGTLNVKDRADKFEITVEAKSDTVTYNGENQSVFGLVTNEFIINGNTFTVEGLTASVTGKDVGKYTSKVTGTAVVKDSNGNDVTSQFDVKTKDGILEICEYADVITVTTKSGVFTYDGTTHSATVEVSDLPQGYILKSATSNAKATDVTTIQATVDHLVIVNAEGEDVTSKLNIQKIDGTIEIKPEKLTISTGDYSKYTGEQDPKFEVKIEGLVNGETIKGIKLERDSGESAGSYTIHIVIPEKVDLHNYEVMKQEGTLTIINPSSPISPSAPSTSSQILSQETQPIRYVIPDTSDVGLMAFVAMLGASVVILLMTWIILRKNK